MSRVPEWLKSAGLSHFTSNFNGIDEEQFLGLQVRPAQNASPLLAKAHADEWACGADARLCQLQDHDTGGSAKAIFPPPGVPAHKRTSSRNPTSR
eukprot:3348744-Rhodomonas_salina.2